MTGPDRPRSLLWLALGLGLATLVGLTAVVLRGPTSVEVAVATLMPTSGPVVAMSTVVSAIGNVAVWWAIALVIALSLVRASPRSALELLVVASAAEAASLALKALVSRARPVGAGPADLIVAAGFPSGHVARVAVVLGACLVLLPMARRHPELSVSGAVLGVVVMALARVAVGDHYIADVLGGMLLATTILAGWALARALLQSRRWIPAAALASVPGVAPAPDPDREEP